MSWTELNRVWNENKKGFILKTLLIILCILVSYYVGIAGLMVVLSLYIIGRVLADDKKHKAKRAALQVMTTCALVYFLYFINKLLGTVSAVLAFVVIVLLLSGYLLYKQRAQYMAAVRSIEVMIFGHTLDKKRRGKK